MAGTTDTVAVPTALVAVLLAAGLAGVISFIAWQTKQIIEHGRIMTRLKDIVTGDNGHGERISELEAWRDGIRVGRAVERSNPSPSE